MIIRAVGAELFHADGPADMTKLKVLLAILRTRLTINTRKSYRNYRLEERLTM
jgi:hypothetical protein